MGELCPSRRGRERRRSRHERWDPRSGACLIGAPRANRRRTSDALVHGWQNAVMMDRDPFLPLRKSKHLGFLNVRRIDRAKVGLPNRVYEQFDPRVPYRFDIERHRNRVRELPPMYFLHRDPPAETTYRDAPHTLLLLRTGENEITPNRQAGIDSIRALNEGLDVVLITPEELSTVEAPGHPLHKAHEHLSLVHRSDYLRVYLMHHHGGAYADIKPMHSGFRNAIDRLNSDVDAWMIGYREYSSDRVGGRDQRPGHGIRRRFRSIAGAGAFALRPGTPLTGEWLREIERRLSYYASIRADMEGHR